MWHAVCDVPNLRLPMVQCLIVGEAEVYRILLNQMSLAGDFIITVYYSYKFICCLLHITFDIYMN
jgi:hypothetical protein